MYILTIPALSKKVLCTDKQDLQKEARKYMNQGYSVTSSEDKPQEGKTYALTGMGNSISNGNTWSESEVK